MTIKDFEEFKRLKDEDEFKAWFKEAAWYHVTIDGIEHPCYKLTSKKVVLGSGEIYNDETGTMRRYSDREEASRGFEAMKLMEVYNALRRDDKVSLLGYASLLRVKESYEKEAEKKRDMAQRGEVEIQCSFCGKTREQVRKLIAGPKETYICDECIEICAEIIEEEENTEKQD